MPLSQIEQVADFHRSLADSHGLGIIPIFNVPVDLVTGAEGAFQVRNGPKGLRTFAAAEWATSAIKLGAYGVAALNPPALGLVWILDSAGHALSHEINRSIADDFTDMLPDSRKPPEPAGDA